MIQASALLAKNSNRLRGLDQNYRFDYDHPDCPDSSLSRMLLNSSFHEVYLLLKKGEIIYFSGLQIKSNIVFASRRLFSTQSFLRPVYSGIVLYEQFQYAKKYDGFIITYNENNFNLSKRFQRRILSSSSCALQKRCSEVFKMLSYPEEDYTINYVKQKIAYHFFKPIEGDLLTVLNNLII